MSLSYVSSSRMPRAMVFMMSPQFSRKMTRLRKEVGSLMLSSTIALKVSTSSLLGRSPKSRR